MDGLFMKSAGRMAEGILLALLILCFVVSATAAGADEKRTSVGSRSENALRIFFIGNSYTQVNGLPRVLTRLGASADPPLTIQTGKHTPGGQTFESHWGNKEALSKKMRQGQSNWDIVVLQEQSQRPFVNPEKMHEYAQKLTSQIAKYNDGEFVFYMTWARQTDPERIEPLAKAYESISAKLDAPVAPVGRAWERAIAERPKLNLYMEDGSHPNQKGTYLAACVFYAVLTGESPLGLSNGGLREISEDDKTFLQEIAWVTVKDYEARNDLLP